MEIYRSFKKILRAPALWLGLIVLAAGILRTLPYLNSVFTPLGTWFLGADPWYQMRLVDNMLVNFPHPLSFDPFALYPGGAAVGYRPLLPLIIAGAAKLIGLGHPSPELVDIIGAYFPVVIGSLTLIPVYLLGTAVFKRRAVGFIAAILLAVLPTEFMHRSLLGFTDHHVLEVFLATWTLALLALAWDKGKARYGALAGLSLALYFFNWHGSIMLAGVLAGAFSLSFLIYYWRHPGENYWKAPIWRAGAVCFAVAGALYLPYIPFTLSPLQFGSIVAVITAAPAMLVIGASLIRSRKGYSALLAGVILVGLAGVYVLRPEIYQFILFQLRGTFWGFGTTIQEAMPYSIGLSLRIYGVLHLVALAGLVLAFKYRANGLFLIWTIVILLATIGQRRWDYYSAVSVCVLSGFFFVWLGKFVSQRVRPYMLGVIVAATILAVFPSMMMIANARPNMTPDWAVAMKWLHEQTAPPFGGEDAYYSLEKPEAPPEYGVISWWDYGHWIIRPGMHVPVSSPTQQETEQGYRFFIAQSEEEAEAALNGMNVKYIIIDRDMVDNKFYAMVLKSGLTEISLAYWQNSLVFRLFYFEGHGFTKYRAIFLSPTVKIFERLGVDE